MNTKVANKLLDQISETAKNNPKALAAVLAGAGVAGIGGGMASASKHDPNESTGSRRMRILRNALLAGAAGGGAVGLGIAGGKTLSNALPKNDVDPASGLFSSLMGRGVMGGTAGTLAYKVGGPARENAALGMLNSIGQKDVQKGSGRETLKALMNREAGGVSVWGNDAIDSPTRQLHGNPTVLRQALIASGIDPAKYNMDGGRFSDHLPQGMKDIYRKGEGMIGDQLRRLPAEATPYLDKMQGMRKTVSRAAYRHPAVAAVTAAGLFAPEVFNAGMSLAGPITSNPFTRS